MNTSKKVTSGIIALLLFTGLTFADAQSKRYQERREAKNYFSEYAISFSTEIKDFSSVLKISNLPIYGLRVDNHFTDREMAYLKLSSSISGKKAENQVFILHNLSSGESVTFDELTYFGLETGYRKYSKAFKFFVNPSIAFVSMRDGENGFAGYELGLSFGYSTKLSQRILLEPTLGFQWNTLPIGMQEGNRLKLQDGNNGFGYHLGASLTILL